MNPIKLPSFDERGQINMSEVIQARPKDFEQFGINVADLLKDLKTQLGKAKIADYYDEKSNIVHNFLNLHQTEDDRKRKANHAHTPLYYFYYNLYCFFMNGCMYYHMRNEDDYLFDQDIMDCEIKSVQFPESFYGRSNLELVDSFTNQTVTIHKGCPIQTTSGQATPALKTYDVQVHHVMQGYYYCKVHHPSIRWAGTGGYWKEAFLKDIFPDPC